jgi:three-Cys-motif partner protein
MAPERLFYSPEDQLAIEFETSEVATRSPRIERVPLLHDQTEIGYGEHDLIPDDENSLSRIVQLHSRDKDYYAFRYADIVSSAMRGKFSSLWWIELFAGPGRLYCQPEERYYDGSPVRALNVKRPFGGYVFNDLDPRCVRALTSRAEGANVHLLQGDANGREVFDYICRVVPPSALVVLYGDPAGLDLDFETLARLAARYPHLDLMLNFPVKWIIRALRGEQGRAATIPGAVPDYGKVSRVLDHPTPVDLVSGPPKTWGPTIRDYFENRLRAIGYTAFETKVIELYGKNVPAYDLMIAGHHELAANFFRKAGEKEPDGQFSLGLS